MPAENGLNYGYLMQKAMRSMMADVLGIVADDGLPGEHYFFISFEVNHPGVDIPDFLRERYDDDGEMTIILQEWFDDLAVTSDRFSVTLNFSNEPHRLVVPFAAVRTFVDPSVKFGLKFEGHEAGEEVPEIADPDEAAEDAPASGEKRSDEDRSAEVVTLDHFRKS